MHQTFIDPPTFCEPDIGAIKMSRTFPCIPEANSLVGKAKHKKNSLPHDVNSIRLLRKQTSHKYFLFKRNQIFMNFVASALKML